MKKLILMLMLFAPIATFAQKFGHINAQEIMSTMPEFKKAQAELESLAKNYDSDMQQMQAEYQRKLKAYQDGEKTMTATVKQNTEEELMKLQQSIQQAYQDNQQAMQKAQQQKMQPITSKLVDAIKAVGKTGGYVYIMDVAAGIPYISETLSKDVTAEVKAELAKMTPATTTAAAKKK